MESGYYETYNRDNVKLVSVLETPIERITPKGLRVGGTDYKFDIIIYATGFDAMLGSYHRIDIRGIGGKSLKEKWAEGPRTFLGIQMAEFPNLMMVIGPHTGASFCNMPRCGEENVDFVTNLIRFAEQNVPRPGATSASLGRYPPRQHRARRRYRRAKGRRARDREHAERRDARAPTNQSPRSAPDVVRATTRPGNLLAAGRRRAPGANPTPIGTAHRSLLVPAKESVPARSR
jgi:cation diffusion facilitator CzcD-associated flavoprotein CzcO